MARTAACALALLIATACSLDILRATMDEHERQACRGGTASFTVRYESLLTDPTIFSVRLDDPQGLYTKKNPFKLSLGAGEATELKYDLHVPASLPAGLYEVSIAVFPSTSPQFTTTTKAAVVVGDCTASPGHPPGSTSPSAAAAATARVTATATAGGGRDQGGGIGAMAAAGAVVALVIVAAGLGLAARGRVAAQQAQQQALAAQGYYGYQYPYQGSSYYAGHQMYGPYQRY